MAAQENFINSLLEAAFNGGTYTGGTITMKLFTNGLPSTTGVEVSGGGYAEQMLSFGLAAGKIISTSTEAIFDDLPTSQTVVAYGVYDDAVLIDEGALDQSFTADVDNNSLEINYNFDLTGA